MILYFRLLAWTAQHEPSHPMLFVLAGAISAALFLGLWFFGVYIDHDRSYSKHGNLKRSKP